MKHSLPILALSAFLVLPSASAEPRSLFEGPFFLGYETEPSMDFGGRTLASFHLAACDLGSLITRRKPVLAVIYEVPLGLMLSTVQHEVNGHGGRVFSRG